MKMSLGGPLLTLVCGLQGLFHLKVVSVEVRGLLFFLGLPSLWEEEWTRAVHTTVCEEDVFAWPYSVCILVKLSAFWAPCIGLLGCVILGLEECHELRAGERLVCEPFPGCAEGIGLFRCRLLLSVLASIFGNRVG